LHKFLTNQNFWDGLGPPLTPAPAPLFLHHKAVVFNLGMRHREGCLPFLWGRDTFWWKYS